jgi:hypothetical protein
MTMRALALACLPLLHASAADAGPCRNFMDRGFAAIVLTPPDATIDQLGGVVLSAQSWSDDRSGGRDPTTFEWQFSDGTHHTKAKTERIAPGLAVMKPVPPTATLDFENLAADSFVHVSYRAIDTDDAPISAAPKVKAVESADRQHNRLGIMRSALVTVTLAAPPPAHVIALVAYGPGGTPRSWAQIKDAGSLDVTIYAVDNCVLQIDGTLPTTAGDAITLAWLDDTGHLSLHTPPIKVRQQR